MKRVFLFLTLIVTLLSACAAPVPVETESPALPTATEPVGVPTEVVPVPKLPAVSFESQTYIDETSGFALDYPADWTVTDAMVGERGSQVQFLSSPDLANLETLPEDATRVSATIYQWDPKNDLAAYVATRKTAWESSGFTILEEEQLILELGLSAAQFTIQTPGGPVVFLITAIGDHYLVVSGEGDLELVKEIVQHVRPISVK